MLNSIMHVIVAFFLLLPHLLVSASHGIPIHQSCPVVSYTPHVLFGQIGPYASQPLYRISYQRDLTNLNPNITIDFVDIHLTSLPPLQGFFNYRMKTNDDLHFYIILPISILGHTFQYWFTTGTFLVQHQQQHFFACDSPKTTFTLPSTGTTNPPTIPPIVRAPGAVCPALIFTHRLDTNIIGTNRYIITFTRASDSPFVEWVDVHILANGGFFNYRMTKETEMEFKHVLQLELKPGTSIVYWFTYSIPNEYETTGILPTRCDTSAYHVVISGSPDICPLLTFTHNVFYSVQYGSQRIHWNVTGSAIPSIRATTVFVHIKHSSGDYTYQMFILPQDPAQQSYYYILPNVLSKPNDTWTYSFTYNMDSGQTCTTDTFTANIV